MDEAWALLADSRGRALLERRAVAGSNPVPRIFQSPLGKRTLLDPVRRPGLSADSVPRFRLVFGSDGEIALSTTAAKGKTMAPLTSPHPTEISTDAPTEELLAPGDVYYVGRMRSLGQAVLVEHDDDDERPLPISDGGRGYSWGMAGSKPVELARGILLDATADERLAAQLCKAFTWEVIGSLPAGFFRLGRSEVLAWVEAVLGRQR
jgi:hypothetical protein